LLQEHTFIRHNNKSNSLDSLILILEISILSMLLDIVISYRIGSKKLTENFLSKIFLSV